MTHFLNLKPQPIQKLKRFQEFVFVSDSAMERGRLVEQLQLSPNSSWLTEVEIGNSINIEQIHAPQNIVRQLRNLKFQPNRRVRLVSKSDSGSVVVDFNNRLIGIGSQIAQRIMVTIAGERK